MYQKTYKSKEIQVSSLIKPVMQKDSLFNGYFLLDPYQNCSFGCLYCDSAEDDTIYIKYNAPEILKRELLTLPRKRVIIGSVHDPYQPIEKDTQLTRTIIKLLLDHRFPLHILTKSTLVQRDIDLLSDQDADVFITFSVVSNNEHLVSSMEPDAPSFHQRLSTMTLLSSKGINTGIALIPILPCLADGTIESIINKAASYHARYVLFQHLFLKGDQKIRFISFIRTHHPSCYSDYQDLFNDSIYPSESYQHTMNTKIKKICGRYNLPTSLPE